MNVEPIWEPSESTRRQARITAYQDWLKTERGLTFGSYDELWKWSVSDLEGFWASIWDYFDIRAARRYERVLAERRMPGAVWFPGAQLNYVDQVFRNASDSRPAIVFDNESGGAAQVSWRELSRQTASLAAYLRRCGVARGDRVVAYMPNIP